MIDDDSYETFESFTLLCDSMRERIEQLEAENLKLKECAEFYSNQDNWCEDNQRNNLYSKIVGDYYPCVEQYAMFGGNKARQTLLEIKENEK